MWLFVVLTILCSLTQSLIVYFLDSKPRSEDLTDLLLNVVLKIHGTESATNSIAHWLFSIEYFKVALKFPIIIDLY